MKPREKKRINRLLYRSFDSPLSKKDRAELDRVLKRSAEWREEKEILERIRAGLAGMDRPSFPDLFPQRVMARLSGRKKPNGLETFYMGLSTTFKRVAAIGIAVLLALLAYNIKVGDSLSSNEVLFASDSTIQGLLDMSIF